MEGGLLVHPLVEFEIGVLGPSKPEHAISFLHPFFPKNTLPAY
jgi:hypothetical protein